MTIISDDAHRRGAAIIALPTIVLCKSINSNKMAKIHIYIRERLVLPLHNVRWTTNPFVCVCVCCMYKKVFFLFVFLLPESFF